MKKHKYHIFWSWLLLICFVAGQYMVYAHQHNVVKGSAVASNIAKNASGQTVKEKCDLCDVMHHNAMAITNHIHFSPAVVMGHVFKSYHYSFTSIQLILAGGRAPPSLV